MTLSEKLNMKRSIIIFAKDSEVQPLYSDFCQVPEKVDRFEVAEVLEPEGLRAAVWEEMRMAMGLDAEGTT